MKSIDITILDQEAIEILEDNKGSYFLIDNYKARILPHSKAKNLTPNDVLSFIVDHLDDLTLNIVASYLYDLIKNGKAKNVKFKNQEPTNDEEEIKKNLKE